MLSASEPYVTVVWQNYE